jgi:ABC-type transport system involved in multi-copper enzyme maturation permease subunit
MFWEVFRFECRFQLRSPLFVAVAGLFFLLGFLIMGTESISVGGVGNNLNLNANFAIIQVQYTMSILGMFAAIAFVAGAITRDLEAHTAELLYSTGLRENDYLFGRFAGGALFAILVGIAAMLGSMLGTFMPWLDQERLAPFTLAPYTFSVWAVIVPNLLVICALFYTVAALTRSMMASYVAALGFIIANVVIGSVTDQEDVATMALFEPFGIAAFGEITRYWTVFDRNFGMPEVTDTLLYNRLIWLGVGALALLLTSWRYRFNLSPSRLRRPTSKPRRKEVPPHVSAIKAFVPQGSSNLAMLFSQLRMDVRGMTRSIPFYVLLAFGMLQVVGSYFGATTQLFGTPVYPVTGLLIQVVGGSFSLAVIVILIYYSGELVHREQQAGIKEIIDAAPYPNVIMVLSKIGALWFVLSVMLFVVLITSLIVQVSLDYYNFELLLYVQGLFGVLGSGYFLLCIPAVMLQTFAPNKFFGMVLFLVFVLTLSTLPSLDMEHLLYLYSVPNAPYSAMNGWGHFVLPMVSLTAYCLALGVLMIVAAHLIYQRGITSGVKDRLAIARSRLNVATGTVALLGLACAAGLGGWIFYNTNVLNEYLTEDDREERQADYEKAYKQYEKLPRPQVVDLEVFVDLYPEERRLESVGTALLVNREEVPLHQVHFSVPTALTINELLLEGATLRESDETLGYYQYEFPQPVEPGAEFEMSWNLSWLNEGFPNSGSSTTRVVANGTFVSNAEIMPIPGYSSGVELTDNNVRRRYELDPVERFPKLNDPEYLGINQFTVAERTRFRTTIATSPDQIAIAPGYLQREWMEGDRRYFEFEMDEKIWPFVSFSSARYAVAEDQWNDVKIEVYYHPAHDYNIDSMIESTKKSLDYFTSEFSPYQYRQFRILEFPAYQRFAQSFPNTIPYSEAIGFIADLREETDIDYVFYVTAHEMAHQWWAHQVVGAQMQGMTVMVETLAQYSALMVMEREFGPTRMRRFLKYELDNYLQGRGGEQIEELPLYLVENQPYVHYRKGSMAMYALRDAVGEDLVNLALRNFLDRWAYSEGVFPTSVDLIDEFRAVAGPEHQALITDLFERIVLFDLQVSEANVVPTDEGFEVSMTIKAAKYEADGSGAETEVPLSQQLDIGIFGARGDDLGDEDLPEPILFESHNITSGEQTLTFTVAQEPERVGIDPYVKMIDRNPDDNLRSL